MALTIKEEFDTCKERFVRQALTSKSAKAQALRDALVQLAVCAKEDQEALLGAVAEFVQGDDMLEIYGDFDFLKDDLVPHLERNTVHIAQVFLQIKRLFKNRLIPHEAAGFERCLNAFELVFNDRLVLDRLRRCSTHQGTIGARYMEQMVRLETQGFTDVKQFRAHLTRLPAELIGRFVLFLEEFADGHLPISDSTEHATVAQLTQRDWWMQIITFAEAQQQRIG